MDEATENPPQEPAMEIHKLKPAHNWREFFVELGTITLGVLIALAAQQTVEWLQWQDKAAYTTEQFQRELTSKTDFFVERVMLHDCIDNRLDVLEQKLLAGGKTWTPVAPVTSTGFIAGNVLALPVRDWAAAAWPVAIADNSVTHISRERLNHYTKLYGLVDVMRGLNEKERDSAVSLNVLSKGIALSDDKRTDLIGVIENQRAMNNSMARLASAAAVEGKQIGLDPAQARAHIEKISTIYAACRAAGH